MFERHQRQLRHDKRTVPAVKLCTVCGVVTSRAGSRCTEHARQSNRSRHNALYSTPAWQRLSARVLRVWRGERGNWCPGYQRHAHRAADLTVDDVVPLAAGGAPFDIGNTAVLCRSCNSTKGASTDRGGVALMAAPMRPDRPGDGTGLWGEAGVTEDRARGGTGDAGGGLQPPPQQDGLDVAREALRIFEDDLTDESAARLRAVLDGTDGYEWGGLA